MGKNFLPPDEHFPINNFAFFDEDFQLERSVLMSMFSLTQCFKLRYNRVVTTLQLGYMLLASAVNQNHPPSMNHVADRGSVGLL